MSNMQNYVVKRQNAKHTKLYAKTNAEHAKLHAWTNVGKGWYLCCNAWICEMPVVAGL